MELKSISKTMVEWRVVTRLKSRSSEDLQSKQTKPLKKPSLPSWCRADTLTLNYIDVRHR